MKQTMQQIMIANLMLLCCCAVFSTPVPGENAPGLTAAQAWQRPADVLPPKGAIPAQWQRRDGETPDVVLTLSADEIERLLSQLRASVNVRSGKPVKAPKVLFYINVAIAAPRSPAGVAARPSSDRNLTGGNRHFTSQPHYFLQPVRAGPGPWIV